MLAFAATARGQKTVAITEVAPPAGDAAPVADASSAIATPAVAAGDAVVTVVAGGASTASQLQLLVNKSTQLMTKIPCKRVAVAQPEIADVNVLGPKNILLTGKKAGSTQLMVWDDNDHAQTLDVTVQVDVGGLQEQLKSLFPTLKLDVRAISGTVAIHGRVPSLAVADQVLQVAKPYSKDVLDLMEISGGQQVMLQVRFAEVSRTATASLGINGAFASGSFSGGSNIGGLNPTSLLPAGTVGAQPLTKGLTNAASVSSAVTLYGAGQIGSVFLEEFISALRQNNLMRMLAEPNVMAISGQEASFIAGGEFPIPVTQGGSGGGAALTIEFREYGVKLKFVPVVLGDGRIRLKLSPEVSDLDYANGVTIGGFRIPGITQRKLSTTVELAEGQTFAVAGLLSNQVSANKDVTPGLGDLPVLGALFRSVRYSRKETELVVLVTPRLVAPMNPADVTPAPGEQWRYPSENDLFWEQDLGGPARKNAPAPKSHVAGAKAGETPRFCGDYEFNQAGPNGNGKLGVASTGHD